MIATARPIAHGQAMTNYATKDFRADIVKVNLLTEDLPPIEIGRASCRERV